MKGTLARHHRRRCHPRSWTYAPYGQHSTWAAGGSDTPVMGLGDTGVAGLAGSASLSAFGQDYSVPWQAVGLDAGGLVPVGRVARTGGTGFKVASQLTNVDRAVNSRGQDVVAGFAGLFGSPVSALGKWNMSKVEDSS